MNQEDYDGRTALHLAASEGHSEIVNFLVNIVNVKKDPVDRWKHTPLDDAKTNNIKEIISLLSNDDLDIESKLNDWKLNPYSNKNIWDDTDSQS